ncbi:MAG: aldehyde dehydrogenase family protein, partial [Bacteroidota bacterium]
QVADIASQYQIGTWDNPNTNIFPIINEKQRTNVIAHIQDAIEKGANVLLGGTEHPEHFVKPTVLTDVPETAVMESEETFGPVVSISGFNEIDEVIARANNSVYGLGASVYGKSNVEAVALQLEAGMIGINKPAGASPWVGAKQSGFGFHGSIDGHRQFTQLKVVN